MATYPPTCWQDIAAYDLAECMEGFIEFQAGDPEPGDNRSPSYRWGWANAASDAAMIPDRFYQLRRQYIRETGMLQTRH